MSNRVAWALIGVFGLALVLSIFTTKRLLVRVSGEYRNDEHGFTIRHPKNWEKKYNWEGSVVGFVSPKENFNDTFQELVTVHVGELEPGMTLDDLVQERVYNAGEIDPDFFEELAEGEEEGEGEGGADGEPSGNPFDKLSDEKNMARLARMFMDLTVLDDYPVDLGPLDGRRVVYKARSGGYLFQYLHFFTVKDDRYFIVTCVTRPMLFEKFQGVFDKMGMSFRAH